MSWPYWTILVTVGIGCAAPVPPTDPPPPRLRIHEDVAEARRTASSTAKPLVVFSVLGHCYRQC